jgi:hypothetical protein
MLTELGGKGGDVCRQAREGEIRCPLIVRPTSEDVITGELFGVLEAINPRWWVSDLLNEALGAPRFRRQLYRRFQVKLWQKQPKFPGHLAPWSEGATEVDAMLTWENPPTTVYVEMKFHSALASKVANHNGSGDYPADQLLRNVRVGLWRCGWYDEERLFDDRRDFALVLLARKRGEKRVVRYRDPTQLRHDLPHSERIPELPLLPFVGELEYADVSRVLERNRNHFGRAERVLVDRLASYLAFKSGPRRSRPSGQ